VHCLPPHKSSPFSAMSATGGTTPTGSCSRFTLDNLRPWYTTLEDADRRPPVLTVRSDLKLARVCPWERVLLEPVIMGKSSLSGSVRPGRWRMSALSWMGHADDDEHRRRAGGRRELRRPL